MAKLIQQLFNVLITVESEPETRPHCGKVFFESFKRTIPGIVSKQVNYYYYKAPVVMVLASKSLDTEQQIEHTLVVTNAAVLALDEIQETVLGDSIVGKGRRRVDVMTGALRVYESRRIEVPYDSVVVYVEKPGNYGHVTMTREEKRSLIVAGLKMTRPGGLFVVVDHGGDEGLKHMLVMSGCTSVTCEEKEGSMVVATGRKFEKKEASAIQLNLGGGSTAWKVSADDEDEELIDEDDLLVEDDDMAGVVEAAPVSGTGPAVKKACANCTCGRAEGKMTKLTKDMIENPQSGCGSCALGDAFRCAGCPYRGLPAFEMGKKIELPPDFLVDDLA